MTLISLLCSRIGGIIESNTIEFYIECTIHDLCSLAAAFGSNSAIVSSTERLFNNGRLRG